MTEPLSEYGYDTPVDGESAPPVVETAPLQPLAQRVRKALKETLVVDDKRNPNKPKVSVFCRNPEQLATILEFLETKNRGFFPGTLELPAKLRKLSELKPGNTIDLSAIHADIKKDRTAHKAYMDVLKVVQSYSDVWLMDLPFRRGKTSHIRKNRGLAKCPEQNVTLFGITLEGQQCITFSQELIKTLEAEDLRTRNKVTVEKGEDIDVKCRNALMEIECTARSESRTLTKDQHQSRFGYQTGWLAAATTHTLPRLPALKQEVATYGKTCHALVKELHPNAGLLERDAMRHAFVSARMAEKYGTDYAIFLGYAVEAVRDMVNANPAKDRAMDLLNNSLGAQHGAAHRGSDDRTLFTQLWNKLEHGELVTSHSDSRLCDHDYLTDQHVAGPFFNRMRKIADATYQHLPEPRSAADTIQHKGKIDMSGKQKS
jgi:hypothetical protein